MTIDELRAIARITWEDSGRTHRTCRASANVDGANFEVTQSVEAGMTDEVAKALCLNHLLAIIHVARRSKA